MAIDRKQLPESAEVLQQMVLDLIAQLDATQARCEKTEYLLRQLLAARSGRSSERLSEDQLALFETEWEAQTAADESPAENDNKEDDPPATPGETPKGNRRGRRPIPGHMKRERIVHDLTESEKHCKSCDKDLRQIGEEVSERYEYIPAQMTVIEDVCMKFTAPRDPRQRFRSSRTAAPIHRPTMPRNARVGTPSMPARIWRMSAISLFRPCAICGFPLTTYAPWSTPSSCRMSASSLVPFPSSRIGPPTRNWVS